MKRLFYLFVLVSLGSSDVNVGGVGSSGDKTSTEPLQNYQTYPYLAPTGYNYNYNNNGYTNNNGYNGYYQQNHQKQDLFNFGNGGGGGDGDFDPSSIGGALGAVLAALGLKGITKLGIAALLLFFFVIIPLFVIPGILSIAAIAVAAVNMGTGGLMKDGGMLDGMKQMFAKNDDGQRALSTFYRFVNNEECIEKISCAISQRAYGRSSRSKSVKPENPTVDSSLNKKGVERSKSKGTFMSRISRALSADDCQTYSCSYFS